MRHAGRGKAYVLMIEVLHELNFTENALSVQRVRKSIQNFLDCYFLAGVQVLCGAGTHKNMLATTGQVQRLSARART